MRGCERGRRWRQWSRGGSIIPKLCCTFAWVCARAHVRLQCAPQKRVLTWKVITQKEIIKLWSKQNRWSHKSSIHMLDRRLCYRTMNHCLSMQESRTDEPLQNTKSCCCCCHWNTPTLSSASEIWFNYLNSKSKKVEVVIKFFWMNGTFLFRNIWVRPKFLWDWSSWWEICRVFYAQMHALELNLKREQSVKAPFLSVLSASAHAEKPNQRDTSKVHVIL